MSENKLELLNSKLINSLFQTSIEMLKIDFSKCTDFHCTDTFNYAVIIGLTGSVKGRFVLKIDEALAKKIINAMQIKDENDKQNACFYLAEFMNIICGNAITNINNEYDFERIRITYPSSFYAKDLAIYVSKLSVSQNCFSTEFGSMIISSEIMEEDFDYGC